MVVLWLGGCNAYSRNPQRVCSSQARRPRSSRAVSRDLSILSKLSDWVAVVGVVVVGLVVVGLVVVVVVVGVYSRI